MSDPGTAERTRPSVAEYLEERGLTDHELAAIAGVKVKTVQSRKSQRHEPIPQVWLDRIAAGNPDLPFRGRDEESPPKPPPGARVVEPEPPAAADVSLDFATLSGYIEGAYKLGAAAIGSSDPALAGAIDSHAAKAGEAWARWVESEPKVAALLQRMMVGTPLGEVIGVHVGIGFAYFLSRSAIDRARREREAAERAAAGESLGADGDGFADFPGFVEPEPATA